MPHAIQRTWWKSATVYQIYPASFCDSNGDGIGDLNGIISKLDYLSDLGIDAVWLSPINKSPQKDMGYDISDYRNIDPRYGTLDDWDCLVKAMHERNIKMIMDIVVNHTSDEHPWFVESRKSKTSRKRNWYIWQPPRYDAEGNRHPPNNWKATFQGSAWAWDENTQEYYLHIYLPGQPDLNWENPEVREAVYDMMSFWVDRGVDGFRMDVINKISKVPGFPDAPISNPREEYQPAPMYYVNGPKVHEYIQELHRRVLADHDLLTVGEAPFTHDMHALARYVLPQNRELSMVFQFELMDIDADALVLDAERIKPKAWKLRDMKHVVNKWQTFLRDEGFWNSVFIENHDQARSVSRFGDDSDEFRAVSAKLLAMLQISQSGTLFVYQGEEIGMKNVPVTWEIEEYKDIASINYYRRILKERIEDGKGTDMSDVMSGLQKKSRDNARTPMQWDTSKHFGFTIGEPWMRANEDSEEWTATSQRVDPNSVFGFWKQALNARKETDVLIYGDFQVVDHENEDIFAFVRSWKDPDVEKPDLVLVILNFTRHQATFNALTLDHTFPSDMRLILSNYTETRSDWSPNELLLQPYEGRIYVGNM